MPNKLIRNSEGQPLISRALALTLAGAIVVPALGALFYTGHLIGKVETRLDFMPSTIAESVRKDMYTKEAAAVDRAATSQRFESIEKNVGQISDRVDRLIPRPVRGSGPAVASEQQQSSPASERVFRSREAPQ